MIARKEVCIEEYSKCLIEILNQKDHKKMVIHLLSNALDLQISNIKLKGKKDLYYLSEYEFSLIQLIIELQNKKERILYLKFIKKGKIRESLFCYWRFLYEELREKEKDIVWTKTHKVSISEVESRQYKDHLLLEMGENQSHILPNGTNVYLLDFLPYIKNTQKQYLETWLKSIPENCQQLLLIGLL